MGKTVKITCDGCGADLTTRSNSVDYRLVLASEGKPGYGAGAYTDMMIYPPVARDFYFCGLGCLDHWRSREHHQSAAWKDANETWKEKTGHKDAKGRINSWQSMPDEMREKLNAEFSAAALAAFPLKHLSG